MPPHRPPASSDGTRYRKPRRLDRGIKGHNPVGYHHQFISQQIARKLLRPRELGLPFRSEAKSPV